MSDDRPSDFDSPSPEPDQETPAAASSEPALEREAQEETLSPEQLAEAKQYHRLQLAADLVDKALDLAFLGVMAFVLAPPIDAWLASAVPLLHLDTLRLAALFLVTMALHEFVSLPLSYYSGYVLEHRFGLSTLDPSGWLARHYKRLALAVALGLVLILGLFWIIWLAGSWWWAVAAAAFFLFSVVLGQLVPVLILPLFYEIKPLDDADLADRMTRLAEGTGLTVEGVYRMALSQETRKANAMLAGLGRTRRILLGDTLLENFTADEIEAVLAHEIGHHVHRHVGKFLAFGAVVSTALFYLTDRLLVLWIAAREPGVFDYAALPVYAMPFLMFAMAVGSLVIEPVRNAMSRHFERQCDRYAVQRTGLREAFISALTKLARSNKADPDPPALEVFLFHDHPPIDDRLTLVREA